MTSPGTHIGWLTSKTRVIAFPVHAKSSQHDGRGAHLLEGVLLLCEQRLCGAQLLHQVVDLVVLGAHLGRHRVALLLQLRARLRALRRPRLLQPLQPLLQQPLLLLGLPAQCTPQGLILLSSLPGTHLHAPGGYTSSVIADYLQAPMSLETWQWACNVCWGPSALHQACRVSQVWCSSHSWHGQALMGGQPARQAGPV